MTGDLWQAARHPGAGLMIGQLPGRDAHMLAETRGSADSGSHGEGAARLGRHGVMGDNRGNADGRGFGSSGSFLPREIPQGRAIQALPGQRWGNKFEPTLRGEHSMINNVYLGRSQ